MFAINYKDPRPIYEQVKDSLRRSIITGMIGQDEKVPSVREAASQLAINPNTIQRAYRELETEGYIYSVPGKGSFAGECMEAKATRKSELFSEIDGRVVDLVHLGVTGNEICAHIMERLEGGAK